MEVKQIYTLLNTVTQEVLGQTGLVAEDLTNIIDVGTQVFDANAFENYTKALVDQVGRMVFVDRVYTGSAPSVFMDGWEFGSVVEKVSFDIPEATENESWNLQDGQSYDQDTFTKPGVTVKFFNSKTTFEVPISITEIQLKSAFQNVNQMNSFLSGIYNRVKDSITVKNDAMVMRTINNFIGETLHNDFSNGTYTGVSGSHAINLLYLYNTERSTSLTTENCMSDPDFLRFCAYKMQLYIDRLAKISTLFNIGKKARFTPRDDLKIVALSEFYAGAKVYMQSDTFNAEMVKLPEAETVAYWQGSGQKYTFDETSSINITTSSGDSIEAGGILAVMFDREALGLTNKNERVTSHYNARAEFTNEWFKVDCSYFNDFNENFIVFYVA